MGRFFKPEVNWNYAVGEVILIFVGITLAIWFNNWNNARQDRALEHKYLVGLHEDLCNDTAALQYTFLQIVGHIEAAEAVLRFQEEGVIEDTLEMVQNLIRSGYLFFFNPDLSTYNDLTNSGNWKVMQDGRLKELLDRYISENDQIEERLDLNKEFVWYQYGLYRRKYLDGRVLVSARSGDAADIRRFPVDWNALRTDRELTSRLSYVISAGHAEGRWYDRLQEPIDELLQLLNELLD